MYAKKIQISNYGPIEHLDIALPFDGENPKPILLVGENGSGKSILLSYIVNGLMVAQGVIYPENSEVKKDKVYKFRSPSYIKTGAECYFGRIEFEQGLHCEELQLHQLKKDIGDKPATLVGDGVDRLWQSTPDDKSSNYRANFGEKSSTIKLRDTFNNNCILYFPPNRFEEPAWLNESSLKAKAQYMNIRHIAGYTNRRIINHSSLHDNQNWLFEVLYDCNAFEIQTPISPPLYSKDQYGQFHALPKVPLFMGYHGTAKTIYQVALSIIRSIFRADGNLRFGIGARQRRTVSLISGNKQLVPNIFQLSTGETSLLSIFLSILRDFDLSGAPFTKIDAIRGIVVVDEIDLHLHAIHQCEVLPRLVKMFPRVQFIVTTHSPLFVLGMEKAFGRDGFALYRLPQGQQISPEEFSEFGNAYQSFAETRRFSDDMKRAVQDSQKPIVFVEGVTDIRYLEKAAELLDRTVILERCYIKDGGGFGGLDKNWKHWKHLNDQLARSIPQKIVLLYDCEKQRCRDRGNVFQRTIPKQEDNPLQKGIENLFEKAILESAKEFKPAFLDIIEGHTKTERGQEITIPEEWTVNQDEKINLCNWLCENGTAEDFKHFRVIFDLLEEILIDDEGVAASVSPGQSPQPEQDHAE